MTLNPDKNGWRHFKIGPVEFGIVCVVIALGIYLVKAQYSELMTSQTNSTVQIGKLTTQVAVMNDQVSSLTSQLANVPSMMQAIAKMQAKQEEHERRIEKLEGDDHK